MYLNFKHNLLYEVLKKKLRPRPIADEEQILYRLICDTQSLKYRMYLVL